MTRVLRLRNATSDYFADGVKCLFDGSRHAVASVGVARVLAIMLLVAAPGCQLSSRAPKPQWVADFHSTTSIVVLSDGNEYVASDAATIRRLRDIYENATWKPHWHTLPGSLDDKKIVLRDGDTILRRFSYTGSLWETESYTENRTAQLSDADERWIESLFAPVSQASPTRTSEIDMN